METIFHRVCFIFLVLFKSYYVVWKLKIDTFRRDIGKRFKSYYVVWKPQKKQEEKRKADGLNRTM